MKQYTLDEYTKVHGFDFYIYDETIDDYLMEDCDTINIECEEWERIKDEIIVNIDEITNEKPTLCIATFIEEEEETEDTEEPTTDDIYRANGFASEADFWRWKEGR